MSLEDLRTTLDPIRMIGMVLYIYRDFIEKMGLMIVIQWDYRDPSIF